MTRILQNQVVSQRIASLDILWAFHESADDVDALMDNHPIVQSLAAAPGNVQIYADVDANHFLPELEKTIAGSLFYAESARSSNVRAGIAGWTNVTPDFLSKHEALATVESALSFLDGRAPLWQDAVSTHVVRREMAESLLASAKSVVANRSSSLQLLLGASGEGKSTVALQFAAMAVADESFSAEVLVLSGDYFGAESAFLQLPESKDYVFIVDDAYRFTSRIQETLAELKRRERKGIHFVLITRDTDWHNSGGSGIALETYVSVVRHHLRGLSRNDAIDMINVWERLGDAALGDLAQCEDTSDRVDSILRSAQGLKLQHNDRTFLGALLVTRYGSGLRDHIAQLMVRLQGRMIRKIDDPTTLLDVLITISLPYAYEVVDLEPAVLEEVYGIDWPSLLTDVLEPLGGEAAVTYNSGRVVVRHEIIASAIIDIALEWGVDLESKIAALVGAAARRLDRNGYAPRTGSIAYIASRIRDIPALSVAAATAAYREVPERLSYVTHLSSALRRARRSEEAVQLNKGAVPLISNGINAGQVRTFLTEWGVAEGNCDHWARNTLLVGISLQDSSTMGEIGAQHSKSAISCLLLALRKLEEAEPADEVVRGIAALTVISRAIGDTDERAWLREAERLVDRRNVSYPDLEDRNSLNSALKGAMWVARSRLETALPQGLPSTSGEFQGLARLASLRSSRAW